MQIIQQSKIAAGEIYDGNGLIFACKEVHLKPFLKDYYKSVDIAYPKFYKMDEQCKLAFIAAEVLLKDFDREAYKDEEIAVVLFNAESSLATDRNYWDSTRSIASPALFVYTLPNIMIGEIAIRHRIKGENYCFLTESYDAQMLFQQTELVFQHTLARAAIVGWVNYENEESYGAKLFLVSNSTEGTNDFNTDNLKKLNN